MNSDYIKNCHVSKSIEFFGDRFCKKWGLVKNVEPEKPLVLFGCYVMDDVLIALNHAKTQKVVIVWAGSDTMNYKNTQILKNNENIHHIAGSKWCCDDLQNFGLKHEYLPITVIDDAKLELKAEPLGEKIYVYTSKNNPAFYGSELINQLVDFFGSNMFYINVYNSMCWEELLQAYKNSFIGVRLVEHDGISETVVELGLLGRMVINNGNEPNCLKYSSIHEIISLIIEEKKKKGRIFTEISENMKKHINIGFDWLKINNYQ